MIHFVVGKPRQGKTLWCVDQIVKYLAHTPQTVVTNVTLDLGRLNEYLQQRFPTESIDVRTRVRIISSREALYFYRYRSGGLILDQFQENKKESTDAFLSRAESYFLPLNECKEYAYGVIYVIDETHNIFNARRWIDCGAFTLFYASQHGHLNDVVYFISQHPDQVEKQLRNLATEWHYLRNFYQRSFGIFSQRGRFVRESYYQQPTGQAKPYERSSFRLDASGVASCYATRGALGVEVQGEEQTHTRRRKLPWWVLWLGVGLAVAAVGGAIWAVPSLVKGYLQRMAGGVESGVSAYAGVEASDSPDTVPVPVETSAAAIPQVRHYVRMSVMGDSVRIVLQDGRIITDDDPRLEMVTRSGVVVWAGQTYYPPLPVETVEPGGGFIVQADQASANPR